MGYSEALEAAGATILKENYFGSYQGDLLIIAEVDGQRRYYNIAYGSCSGCDAFEADYPNTPEELKAFGERYIDDYTDYDTALALAKKNLEWDMDAKEMVAWLEANKE